MKVHAVEPNLQGKGRVPCQVSGLHLEKRMLSFETGRKEACQGSGADICVRDGEKVEEISSL